jgi:primosomal protein N' (replication factor Y)
VFADVAIPRSAPEPLTYRVPPEWQALARPGVRARVTVRGRAATGLVVAVTDDSQLDPTIIRDLGEVLDPTPLLPAHLLDLASFASRYYRCPLGDTVAAMLPASLLRSDAEELTLTHAGVRADLEPLSSAEAALLQYLAEHSRARTATALAATGCNRRTVAALEHAGLLKVVRRRRDRPPQREVPALRLAQPPSEELQQRLGRAPRRLDVVDWIAEQGRPVRQAEVLNAVGCSPGVINALVRDKILERFTQPPSDPPRWALRQPARTIHLSPAQATAVGAITSRLRTGGYEGFLLHGVTSSGKTEVYLRCLDEVLKRDRRALVLVPEIGLTPATVGAVQRRFGTDVAVMHSAQSEGERWRQWRSVRDGQTAIVVGPRSAVFAPIANLGLIVVDEEHDGAYKQNEAPRYNARDLALLLARRLEIPALLCSATPSLEAHQLVQDHRLTRLHLGERVGGAELPEVELVDLRQEPPEPGEQGATLFSRRLIAALQTCLDRNEQAILLMQRRGWAPTLLCRDCGTSIECPHCSVSLVVHRRQRGLHCHYCGYSQSPPRSCASCGGTLLDPIGAGTEKIAVKLQARLPSVTVGILDRDTVRRRDGLESTLGAFESGALQVLVGTQMVAKGHHFPNVTVTGVVSADAMLSLPDFRAGERTFQLLTQVAGRAGRGDRPGTVIIQTYHPEHPAVRHALTHDTDAFLAAELLFRKAFRYPPTTRMAILRFESDSEDNARRAAEEASRILAGTPVHTRGPAPAPLAQVRGLWRWQLLLTAPTRSSIHAALGAAEAAKLSSGVRRVVDIDPQTAL